MVFSVEISPEECTSWGMVVISETKPRTALWTFLFMNPTPICPVLYLKADTRRILANYISDRRQFPTVHCVECRVLFIIEFELVGTTEAAPVASLNPFTFDKKSSVVGGLKVCALAWAIGTRGLHLLFIIRLIIEEFLQCR
jgi:hypothetical protein